MSGISPENDESSEISEEDSNNNGSDDPQNGMPGQLPTEQDQPIGKDCLLIKKAALEKINDLVGSEVTVGTRKGGTKNGRYFLPMNHPT